MLSLFCRKNLLRPGRLGRSGRNQGAGGAGGNAAVDEQSLSGDVAAGFGGKEHYRSIQVFRLPRTFERDPVAKILHPFFVFVEHFVLFSAKPARREAVHRDPVLAPVIGEAHGQLPNASAARSVRTEPGVTGNAGYGANINDATVASPNH